MKKNKQKNRRLKRYIRKQISKKFKEIVLVYSVGRKGAERFILNVDGYNAPHSSHAPRAKLLPEE